MIEAVAKRWKRRASALKKAEYEPLSGRNLQYARNCPPLGVRLSSAYRACHMRPCPFCWGRRTVLKLWHRFAAAAFESKTHRRTNPKYDIVMLRTLRHFDDIESAIRAGKSDRNREASQIPCVGSGLVLTVEPRRGKEGFTTRQSGVLIVERHIEVPSFGEDTDVIRHEVSTREAMAKCIGSVARYPEGYMRESVDRAMEALIATKGMFQSTFSGTMFRKT